MKTVNKKYSASSISRPFENLHKLIKSKSLHLASYSFEKPVHTVSITSAQSEIQDEQKLFQDAMADVIPISKGKYIKKIKKKTCRPVSSDMDHDSETISKLHNLVKYGHGFIVSDTPEYMEGRGYNVSPEIVKRLHRGDFSIQGHIDLHGLDSIEAKEEFDYFFKNALMDGKRTVLVVHGRGLSSPLQPVLKTKVCQWLTTGPLRKWVMAFSSARSCDGGTGATYVLLRSRPITRNQRKQGFNRYLSPS